MVLKQRHSSGGPSSMMLQSPAPPPSSGGGGVSRQQHLAHLSREGSAVSLPYGSALSPTSSSASSALPGVGGTNNVVRRSQSASTPGAGGASASASALAQQQQQQQHRPLHLSPVPPSAGGAYGRSQSVSAVQVGGALSPTFFGTHTPTPTSKSSKRRSFWSSFADFTTGGGRYGGSGSSIQGRRLSSSPSKGPRRHPNPNKAPLRSTLLAVLYVAAILSSGYLTVVTSRQLAAMKSRHAQMKNDYHVLHHKVRETQSALQTANQINHDLEDRSKSLARQNDGLQKELDGMMIQDNGSGGGAALESISPALLGKGGGDETLAGLQGEEITQLLIRRQDAMRGRIGTLQTKIQEISRREAEERFGKGPHRVEVQVDFNAGVPSSGRTDVGVFIIEMAPLSQMPHSVHLFLQMVAHKLWDDTVFLHTTNHVLQAAPIDFTTGRSKRDDFADASLDQLSFQEYSEDYPHVKYTIGFGGRPGGPDFYISTQDNSKYHGPGGQGHHDLHEEADPCFGLVVEGQKIVDRMHRRSIATVGKNGEAWDGKDVPITSIVSIRVMDQ